MLIEAAENLAKQVGVAPACQSIGLARSTLYYQHVRNREPVEQPKARPRPARALHDQERQRVLDVLHSERSVDKAPAEYWPP